MRLRWTITVLLCFLPAAQAGGTEPRSATFSIVAYDSVNQDWGVAVASKFFAVGSVVPWAKAGVGAIASQAYGNTSFGPRGLALLEQGADAQAALNILVNSDTGRAQRQVGVVDVQGNSATFTGGKCNPWAGGVKGKHYACQGNILTGENVVRAMARAFESAKGELAERLMAALEAGDAAGGDSRGRQSAAMLVVRPRGGYGGWNDRYLDIRVDDHPDPLKELHRLLDVGLTMSALTRAWNLRGDGKLEDALVVLKRTIERSPQSGDVWYDYACYLSLLGRKPQALEALGKGLKLQPKLLSLAKTDADLDNLREERRFRELVR
jgi:uncharacterized Ntn-hydrolase superfamily protein